MAKIEEHFKSINEKLASKFVFPESPRKKAPKPAVVKPAVPRPVEIEVIREKRVEPTLPV